MLQFFPRQSQTEMLQIIESPEERKEVYPTGFKHRFLGPDHMTLKLVLFCFFLREGSPLCFTFIFYNPQVSALHGA